MPDVATYARQYDTWLHKDRLGHAAMRFWTPLLRSGAARLPHWISALACVPGEETPEAA